MDSSRDDPLGSLSKWCVLSMTSPSGKPLDVCDAVRVRVGVKEAVLDDVPVVDFVDDAVAACDGLDEAVVVSDAENDAVMLWLRLFVPVVLGVGTLLGVVVDESDTEGTWLGVTDDDELAVALIDGVPLRVGVALGEPLGDRVGVVLRDPLCVPVCDCEALGVEVRERDVEPEGEHADLRPVR